MEEISLDPENPGTIENALQRSCETLSGGGVIIFPTDTIYGLGANAYDEEAIAKIYRIKQRDPLKPISILVRDIDMAKRAACIDSKAEAILARIWPGSVTVILRKKDAIPYALTGGEEKIAVRVSQNPFIQSLFARIDFPVTATSANLAGEPNLLRAEDIRGKFSGSRNSPDLFIDAGDLGQRLPSTIVDLTDVNQPRLVRMGAVGKDRLDEFFKNFIG